MTVLRVLTISVHPVPKVGPWFQLRNTLNHRYNPLVAATGPSGLHSDSHSMEVDAEEVFPLQTGLSPPKHLVCQTSELVDA